MRSSVSKESLAALLLLLLACCLIDPAAAQTNRTNATTTTPAPTGSGVVLVLYINGVFVNLTCNISLFGNITCASDYDHVVTVTRLEDSTDNTILYVLLGLMGGLVVIVAGVAGAAYYNSRKNTQNYQPMPNNVPQAPYPDPGYPPQGPYPDPGYPQEYMPPPAGGGFPQYIPQTPYQPGGDSQQYPDGQYFRGQGANLQRKVISVNLVRPCLPEEPLAVMRMA
jgi:hypothetical protein